MYFIIDVSTFYSAIWILWQLLHWLQDTDQEYSTNDNSHNKHISV